MLRDTLCSESLLETPRYEPNPSTRSNETLVYCGLWTRDPLKVDRSYAFACFFARCALINSRRLLLWRIQMMMLIATTVS